MSERISPWAQVRYTVELVCRTWGFARSSFYHHQHARRDHRRGRTPRVDDEKVLNEIKATIERSPFTGEGHQKVHAQIKRRGEIPSGRNRVLKLMEAHKLLSPYRLKQGAKKAHDERITTDVSNEMWGTDAAKIYTLEDGWVWFFGVFEC